MRPTNIHTESLHGHIFVSQNQIHCSSTFTEFYSRILDNLLNIKLSEISRRRYGPFSGEDDLSSNSISVKVTVLTSELPPF
ncbi:hypothetical protein Mapa_007339 [Marchantia paleacea]|nr:hypothetical protein Mapa_007339 [Marchantia paleacea]